MFPYRGQFDFLTKDPSSVHCPRKQFLGELTQTDHFAVQLQVVMIRNTDAATTFRRISRVQRDMLWNRRNLNP